MSQPRGLEAATTPEWPLSRMLARRRTSHGYTEYRELRSRLVLVLHVRLHARDDVRLTACNRARVGYKKKPLLCQQHAARHDMPDELCRGSIHDIKNNLAHWLDML